jgi:hypothetical protein
MRQYFSLLLVLAVLITAGCVEDTSQTTAVTRVPTPATTQTVVTNTPTQTPTSPPAEMAYISNVQCAVIDESVATYHCKGTIRIHSGASSHDLQVIAKYPDNNTFKSGMVTLGGDDPVSMPFILFADVKYKDKTPDYFIKMDKTVYPVVINGNGGTAWSNLTAGQEVIIP